MAEGENNTEDSEACYFSVVSTIEHFRYISGLCTFWFLSSSFLSETKDYQNFAYQKTARKQNNVFFC